MSAAQCDAPLADSDRLSCLYVAASLTGQLAERHAALPAAAELFAPLRLILAAVDVRRWAPVEGWWVVVDGWWVVVDGWCMGGAR